MSNMIGSMSKIFQKLGASTVNMNILQTGLLRFIGPMISNERSLYSKSTLGLDTYEQQRERTRQQLSNLEDKFKTRMKEFVEDEKNMIFTEDLKNMVHLVNTDEEIDLVVAMIKRFNQQNKQLRFGNFKFGPVVMRLFHTLNKPDVALKCFKSDEFQGFFDQLITYQIYLDLLYENGMYKEVLENFDVIKNRQIEGAMFPRNSIVLVLAACYKLNTAESLDYAFKLWKMLEETGYYPTRRAATFCAGLALNQGKPSEALEIISNTKNQNYTTVRNIKALALASMGRLEDVLPVLRSVLEEDKGGKGLHTFNSDVMDKIKEGILAADNAELSVEFNRLEEILKRQGQITEKTLDDQLCSQIQNNPVVNQTYQDRFADRNRGMIERDRIMTRRQGAFNRRQYGGRPGLEDLA